MNTKNTNRLNKHLPVRYAFEHYGRHGFLSPPYLLWLGWFFIAKAWVILTVAGASRENGDKILTIVYPEHSLFYLGLALGFPCAILMWLVGLRSPERKWINYIVRHGKLITIISIIGQFIQVIYHVYLEHGAFNYVNALLLLTLLWLGLYVINSKHVKDCFLIEAL